VIFSKVNMMKGVQISVLASLAGVLFISAHAAMAAEVLPPGHAVAGAAVFHECMGCHAVGPSAQNGVGPSLNGVVGRHSASAPGYHYSSALRGLGVTWTPAELSRFLASPSDMAPGTRMGFGGLAQPQARADVIAYLQQYGAGGQHAAK
jgi:cytochrome c